MNGSAVAYPQVVAYLFFSSFRSPVSFEQFLRYFPTLDDQTTLDGFVIGEPSSLKKMFADMGVSVTI